MFVLTKRYARHGCATGAPRPPRTALTTFKNRTYIRDNTVDIDRVRELPEKSEYTGACVSRVDRFGRNGGEPWRGWARHMQATGVRAVE